MLDLFVRLLNLFKSLLIYFGFSDGKNHGDNFYQLLRDGNYDEALKLAQQHKYLDIDLVYKCRWRNSGITVQSINYILNSIQDKLWTINECVQTVPISYEACRTLIDFGLKEANLRFLYELGHHQTKNKDKKPSDKWKTRPDDQERAPSLDPDLSDEQIEGLIDFDHLTDQQKELCRCRQDLIRYEHSLSMYESILGDYRAIQAHFDHVFYDELRQKCPLQACVDYAHNGNAQAVETILDFYTNDTADHIIPILSNFPETISPYQYRNLLPCLREGESVYKWRSLTGQIKRNENDWSSRCDYCKEQDMSLKNDAKVYEAEFYTTDERLKKYIGEVDGELLSEWYISRSLEMISRTLLLSSAIQLLHLGSQLNIVNLTKTHDDLIEFDHIIYNCSTDKTLYLSYEEFKKMSKIDRILVITGDIHEACLYIMKKNQKDCWSLCHQLGVQKEFKNNEVKYKLLGYALAHCDDTKMCIEILNCVIDLRKHDEKVQLLYLERNM